jgi:hypothetical protein
MDSEHQRRRVTSTEILHSSLESKVPRKYVDSSHCNPVTRAERDIPLHMNPEILLHKPKRIRVQQIKLFL